MQKKAALRVRTLRVRTPKLLLPFFSLLCSCFTSSQVADHYFETQQYQNAAVSYEILFRHQLLEKGHDRALYRLALTHLMISRGKEPGLEKANQVLRYLIRRYPRSPYGPLARVVLSFQDTIRNERARFNALKDKLAMARKRSAALDKRTADLCRSMEGLKTNVIAAEARLQIKKKEQELLKQEVGQLQDQLTQQEQKNAKLIQELTELKRIDMQRDQ